MSTYASRSSALTDQLDPCSRYVQARTIHSWLPVSLAGARQSEKIDWSELTRACGELLAAPSRDVPKALINHAAEIARLTAIAQLGVENAFSARDCATIRKIVNDLATIDIGSAPNFRIYFAVDTIRHAFGNLAKQVSPSAHTQFTAAGRMAATAIGDGFIRNAFGVLHVCARLLNDLPRDNKAFEMFSMLRELTIMGVYPHAQTPDRIQRVLGSIPALKRLIQSGRDIIANHPRTEALSKFDSAETVEATRDLLRPVIAFLGEIVCYLELREERPALPTTSSSEYVGSQLVLLANNDPLRFADRCKKCLETVVNALWAAVPKQERVDPKTVQGMISATAPQLYAKDSTNVYELAEQCVTFVLVGHAIHKALQSDQGGPDELSNQFLAVLSKVSLPSNKPESKARNPALVFSKVAVAFGEELTKEFGVDLALSDSRLEMLMAEVVDCSKGADALPNDRLTVDEQERAIEAGIKELGFAAIAAVYPRTSPWMRVLASLRGVTEIIGRIGDNVVSERGLPNLFSMAVLPTGKRSEIRFGRYGEQLTSGNRAYRLTYLDPNKEFSQRPSCGDISRLLKLGVLPSNAPFAEVATASARDVDDGTDFVLCPFGPSKFFVNTRQVTKKTLEPLRTGSDRTVYLGSGLCLFGSAAARVELVDGTFRSLTDPDNSVEAAGKKVKTLAIDQRFTMSEVESALRIGSILRGVVRGRSPSPTNVAIHLPGIEYYLYALTAYEERDGGDRLMSHTQVREWMTEVDRRVARNRHAVATISGLSQDEINWLEPLAPIRDEIIQAVAENRSLSVSNIVALLRERVIDTALAALLAKNDPKTWQDVNYISYAAGSISCALDKGPEAATLLVYNAIEANLLRKVKELGEKSQLLSRCAETTGLLVLDRVSLVTDQPGKESLTYHWKVFPNALEIAMLCREMEIPFDDAVKAFAVDEMDHI